MSKKKKQAPLFEYREILYVGKSIFAVWGNEGEIAVYRAFRKNWVILGTRETFSGAKSLILDNLTMKSFLVDDAQKWLKELREKRK